MSAYLDEEGMTCDKVSGRPCYCCGKALPTGRLVMRKSCSDSSRRWVRFSGIVGFGFSEGLNFEETEGLRRGWKDDRRCCDCHKCGQVWTSVDKCGVSREIYKAVETGQAYQ